MNRFKLRRLIQGLSISSLLLASAVNADPTLYANQCAACHSKDGSGNTTLKTPSIAGLDAAYLLRQLSNFRNGLRGHQQDDASAQLMRQTTLLLTEAKLSSLAKHISTLPIPQLTQAAKSTGFRGRGLYSGCSSCHGANGEGNDSLGAPRLAQQHMHYLRAQLQKFRQDQRGFSDTDHFGIQMRSMAKDIRSPEDLATLVNYIAKLKGKTDQQQGAH